MIEGGVLDLGTGGSVSSSHEWATGVLSLLSGFNLKTRRPTGPLRTLSLCLLCVSSATDDYTFHTVDVVHLDGGINQIHHIHFVTGFRDQTRST